MTTGGFQPVPDLGGSRPTGAAQYTTLFSGHAKEQQHAFPDYQKRDLPTVKQLDDND